MSNRVETLFTKLDKLGEGTYGIVFKAKNNETGQIVALKVMKPNQEEEGISPITLREISILRHVQQLNHPNIVKLLDTFVKDQSITLVFEYLDIDLRKYMKKLRIPMDTRLIRSYAFQLLAAIYVLHTHRVMHRDLKPENILLDAGGHLKLADFGLARYFSVPMRQYSPEIVSLWYRAPELLFEPHCYDLSVDVWAAGCIIAEMSSKEVLFHSDSETDLLHKILSVLGTPEDPSLIHLPPGVDMPQYEPKSLQEVLKTDDMFLVDLVSKMLLYDPVKRITAIDALSHQYFDSLSQQVKDMSLPPDLL